MLFVWHAEQNTTRGERDLSAVSDSKAAFGCSTDLLLVAEGLAERRSDGNEKIIFVEHNEA